MQQWELLGGWVSILDKNSDIEDSICIVAPSRLKVLKQLCIREHEPNMLPRHAHLMLQLESQLWLSSAVQGYNARPCQPDASLLLLLLLPASSGRMAIPFNTNWPRHFSNAAGSAAASLLLQLLLLLPPLY
jgi:hypothetical protein